MIIKTLALSKLSHLAFVLPDISQIKLKKLENIIFKFLWDNKPDKVSRDHAKLSEKAGGLGMPDLTSFWLSLKFSWLRRACNTNAFWPNILEKEANTIISKNFSIIDILQLGPNLLSYIGKKLKNPFWKPVLCAVNPFMQGAIFCHSENIINLGESINYTE